MRNMSFMLTAQQILDETKDVTRRLGWWFLKPGDVVMACEKCMGLKKGEHVKKFKPIRILSTRPEPLNAITKAECVREGFLQMLPIEFTEMFCKHNRCLPDITINRIEFSYNLEASRILPMQSCGHPKSAIQGNGITHWCHRCEKEGAK